MKRNNRAIYVLSAVILLILSAQAAVALGNLEFQAQHPIAPASIPIDSDGNAPDKVGMVRLDMVVDPSFTSTVDVDSFDVELIGTIPAGQVANLYVYYEQQDGGTTNDGLFDPGSSSTLVYSDTGVDLSSPVTATFSPALTINKYANGGTAYVYVAFDFIGGSIDSIRTVGCNIINVNGDTGADGQPPVNSTVVNLDDYEVTITGDTSGLGLAGADPGPGDTQTALQLDFGIDDASLFLAPPTGGYATIDMLRFHNMGTAADGDFDPANAVIVFRDADGDEIYDTGEQRGSGSMSGGYAVVNLDTPITIYDTRSTYYAAVRLSSNPTHGNTVGLRVEDPSDTSNVSFADGIDDTASGYVETDTYNQEGFISDSGAQPASPDTFTIITDPDPPEVSDTTPQTDAPGVSRYLAEVRVVFNEDMDAATIVDANFVLEKTLTSTPISGSVSISGDNILVFSITEDLEYDTNYTATVTGPGGVADLVGNEMAADYTWSFQTELAVHPNVTSTFPDEDADDVAVDIASVRAVFSERMDPATIIPANFSLVGPSGPVDGTLTYEENPGPVYRLVFDPDSELEYNKTYTVTVTTGVEDLDELNMLSDKIWQFTTIRLYPEFDEPIAIKNRIGSGTNDQTLIFVPEPPGGTATRMSVQVFTTTGKLVRTFYRNVPWSTIGEDPIAWDGTNDRGQNLGPGLYFVQIRAADYKRVLKVMIVR